MGVTCSRVDQGIAHPRRCIPLYQAANSENWFCSRTYFLGQKSNMLRFHHTKSKHFLHESSNQTFPFTNPYISAEATLHFENLTILVSAPGTRRACTAFLDRLIVISPPFIHISPASSSLSEPFPENIATTFPIMRH